jgi:hypothetical protein
MLKYTSKSGMVASFQIVPNLFSAITSRIKCFTIYINLQKADSKTLKKLPTQFTFQRTTLSHSPIYSIVFETDTSQVVSPSKLCKLLRLFSPPSWCRWSYCPVRIKNFPSICITHSFFNPFIVSSVLAPNISLSLVKYYVGLYSKINHRRWKRLWHRARPLQHSSKGKNFEARTLSLGRMVHDKGHSTCSWHSNSSPQTGVGISFLAGNSPLKAQYVLLRALLAQAGPHITSAVALNTGHRDNASSWKRPVFSCQPLSLTQTEYLPARCHGYSVRGPQATFGNTPEMQTTL